MKKYLEREGWDHFMKTPLPLVNEGSVLKNINNIIQNASRRCHCRLMRNIEPSAAKDEISRPGKFDLFIVVDPEEGT